VRFGDFSFDIPRMEPQDYIVTATSLLIYLQHTPMWSVLVLPHSCQYKVVERGGEKGENISEPVQTDFSNSNFFQQID